MTPATHNFDVVRGSSGPTNGLVFSLQAGDPLANIPYEDVRLSVYDKKGNNRLFRATLGNGGIVLLDAPTNQFAWVPTTEHTRLIPKGLGTDELGKAYYELEVWNGEYETVYMIGYIHGIGGVNDDIDGTNSDGDS